MAKEPFELQILQPDDFHHHFRDEPYLEHTVQLGCGWNMCLKLPEKSKALPTGILSMGLEKARV